MAVVIYHYLICESMVSCYLSPLKAYVAEAVVRGDTLNSAHEWEFLRWLLEIAQTQAVESAALFARGMYKVICICIY
jgi:hypothetical protein